MAKVKSFQTDIRRERKKKKIKRFLRRFAIVLCIVAAAAAAFFTRNLWVPWFEGILDRAQTVTVNDGELEKGNFPISVGEAATGANLLRFDDDFILATDTYINFYKSNGEHINSIQHKLSDPVVKIGDDRLLVYDRAGNRICVMNEKEVIFERELDEEIYFAQIASNDSIAVVTTAEGFPSYLTVYNKDGEVIYRFANGTRFTSVDFKPSGFGCYVSAFEIKGGSMVSGIYSLDFDSDKVEFRSDDIQNTAIIKTVRLSDGDLVAVCDDRFVRLDKNGKVKSSAQYKSDIIDFDATEEVVSIAVEGISSDNDSKLIIIRSDSDEIQMDIDKRVKSLRCDTKNTYVLTDDSIEMFSFSGKKLATAKVSSEYVDFISIDDEVLFLGYREINKIEYSY